MSELVIGLVLPEVLGTYGDDGNALVLRQRARLRGIDATIQPLHLGEPLPDSLDIYCLGGGEDTAQTLAAEHLRSYDGLVKAANKGAAILAICAGFQVLGETFRAGNKTVAGVGLLDARTGGLSKRAIGELLTEPIIDDLDQPLTGFENHMGATVLGPDASPLGRVITGVGNSDADGAGYEGACQGSIIATYHHGPVLARNPQLADLLLARALGVAPSELPAIDLPIVEQLRSERLNAARG